MCCSKSLIWQNSAYATAVQIFDLANGELQCHHLRKEVAAMKKYIPRIIFLAIVLFIVFTVKVK